MGADDEVWLGGNDIDTEGTFKWSNENSTLMYSNFHETQPNNNNAFFGQDCLTMKSDGFWFDHSCAETQRFVCQWEVLCENSLNETCYVFEDEQALTWENAEQFCNVNYGGNLVAIHDADTQRFLENMLISAGNN